MNTDTDTEIYIDIAVILDSNMEKFPFSLKELNNLRKVNKNYNNAIKNFKYIEESFKIQFNDLITKSLTLDYDIISLLKNSDINFVEFEKIINNMHSICNRKYREKYGYLLEQKLINKYKFDDNNIQSTLNVYKCLFNYSIHLMTQQKYAPTLLTKYVLLWISDYVRYIYIKKNPNKSCNIALCKLFNDNDFIYLKNFDIYKFYELIVNCINKTYTYTDLFAITEHDLKYIIEAFIIIHIYIKKYYNNFNENQDEREKEHDSASKYILLAMLDYIYNSVKHIGIIDINILIIQLLKNKCIEFQADTNNSTFSIHIKINNSASQLLNLLKSSTIN